MFFVKELSSIFTWADNSCKHEIILFDIYLLNGSRMKFIGGGGNCLHSLSQFLHKG